MAKMVENERNMTNLEAQYITTGDSPLGRIPYFVYVQVFSHIVAYVKNMDIIFQHISIPFHWWDKIGCIRANCAII